MSAATYRFRAELRAGGWRFVLGASLLLGLGCGAALLAVTDARRTSSAFTRLERSTSASHVLVNPDNQELTVALSNADLDEIEGVEDVSTAEGVLALFDGKVGDAAIFAPAPGSDWFELTDRPVVREGRLPDQGRADEVFANPAGARSVGLEVGDTVDLTVVSADEFRPELLEGGDPEVRIEQLVADGVIGRHLIVRLVGIGVTAADVVPGGELDALYLTNAFTEQFAPASLYGGIAVRLTDGTDGVDRFIGDVRALVPPDSVIDFQTLASDRATVQRAVAPQVVALSVIAVVLAIGSVLAVGQTLGRRTTQELDDDATLETLGMTDRERRQVDRMRLSAVVAAGTLTAVAVAVALSPVTPTGLARDIDPSTGWWVDGWALALGAGLVATASALVGLAYTSRSRGRASRAIAPSAVASWIRARAVSVPLAFGVGLALERGRGRTAVPTRSTLVTATAGMAALIASLTFASSLDQLVTTPRDYGSDFEVLIQGGDLEGRERTAFASLSAILDDSDDVSAWSQLYTEQLALPHGVVAVNAVGFEKSDTASPTLVAGRFPRRADEIALGAVTMSREGVDLGDSIDVESRTDATRVPLTVVGQVILPGVASYQASDQAALGVGAMLSLEGLAALTGATSYGDPSDSATIPAAVLVDLRSGASVDELGARLVAEIGPGGLTIAGPIRSSDIASLERVRSTPIVLALLLGLIASVAAGHALVVAVRRRRRDLAVLRALGFTRAQISRTVGWQATTVAGVAAVIGIPLGVVCGRIAWGAVTRRLGVVDRPSIPVLGVLLALPAAALFANLAALLPGRRAAQAGAAQILREP